MIADWAASRGVGLDPVRLYQGESLPHLQALKEAEGLVVLGGPMGVYDQELYPWLSGEIEFLKKALAYGVPAFGVCLGAQLIAAASGARVAPMGRKEIGWWPVDDLESETSFTAFHWHGDRFDLPPGATHLYSNENCREQGFRIGSKVWALQFHLEMNREAVERIIAHSGDELKAEINSPTVAPADTMITKAECYAKNCFSRLSMILDELFYRV